MNDRKKVLAIVGSYCKGGIVDTAIDVWTGKRSALDYDIDGIVFSADSMEVHEAMGWTGKRPNAAIAYKFPAECKESTVKGIHW